MSLLRHEVVDLLNFEICHRLSLSELGIFPLISDSDKDKLINSFNIKFDFDGDFYY